MSINFDSTDVQELLTMLNSKGKIEDKEAAIKLLIITPKAWNLLSSELKNDKEVMLYYQPEGYIEHHEGPTVGPYIAEEAALYCDKSFKIDANMYIGDYVTIHINSLVPKCVLRKDKKFVKAYIDVQKRMKTKKVKDYNYYSEKSRKEFEKRITDMHSEVERTDYPYIGSTDGYISSSIEYAYDKSDLSEIVNDEYQKYLSK